MGRGILVVLLLVFTGCFEPQVKNGGFTCHPPDHPQCPDGQECVNGICQIPGTTIDSPNQLPDASPNVDAGRD